MRRTAEPVRTPDTALDPVRFCWVTGPLFCPSLTGASSGANMAAKAGDDPDSLMTLATVFCLRNLRKTMCYQGFRNKLCMRADIFLPSEICDKLVNTYADRRSPPGRCLSPPPL
ncbi:hypothetical protein CCH79_00019139 [Gambusia affinis]|uniref:Uncharacterized protein n=1 Tax=Gambusia affinis TaxID=33528 RepID=A0A315VL13_GAMAF|nr:hypothetical protein CCH79_00019139 [Gambusia affinis]